jgi:hypothetical protein
MKRLPTSRLVGFLFIFIGIIVNKWTLFPLADDGEVSVRTGLFLLFVFQLPAILAGAIIIFKSASPTFPSWLTLALLMTSITFSIAVIELTLSRFNKPSPRAFVGDYENRVSKNFVVDQFTGWRMRPNTEFRWQIDGQWDHYRSNQQGFRNELDFSQDALPNRIILVGDSFTFGTGVEIEETFGALLDVQLGRMRVNCSGPRRVSTVSGCNRSLSLDIPTFSRAASRVRNSWANPSARMRSAASRPLEISPVCWPS